MSDVALAHPEEHIFTPSATSSDLRVLVALTLVRAGLQASEAQRVLFFVSPERIWLSRLPLSVHRALKRELASLNEHYRYNPRAEPVTLMFGAPGSWALHLRGLELSEKETAQDHLCFAYSAEELALLVRGLARNGSNVKELRLVLDLRDGIASAAPAQGAAALVFAHLARGSFRGLRHLSLLFHSGSPSLHLATSPLVPLGRLQCKLERLLVLRLALGSPREPLRHITMLARNGGLPNLRTLVFFGSTLAEDRDVADLIRALLRSPGDLVTGHPLRELDLRATLAGPDTVAALVERLEGNHGCSLRSVLLDGTPAGASSVLVGTIEHLLLSKGAARTS